MNGLDHSNNGPFNKRTVLDHFNTKLVPYSDLHCVWIPSHSISNPYGSNRLCIFNRFALGTYFNCSLIFFQMIDDGCSSGDDDNNYSIDWLQAPDGLRSLNNANLSPGNNGSQRRTNSRRSKVTIEVLTDDERRVR